MAAIIAYDTREDGLPTRKQIVVPYVVEFEDKVHNAVGWGVGIEALVYVRFREDKTATKIFFQSKKDGENFLKALKNELEDFFKNYTSYVQTLSNS